MSKKRDYGRVKHLLVAIVLIFSAIYGVYITESQSSQNGLSVSKSKNIMNVMILGVDKRTDDAGRSDTLMVISYNKDTSEMRLLSIPRDTRVELKDDNYEKINHAFAYNGVNGSRAAVEKLLDIKIDHYVLIDTKAFPKIIDAMGGLLLYVDKRMYYEDPWDDEGLIIDLYPGEQYLDGDRAIQYVRYRDEEGDMGRIKRQQKFVRAVLNELMSKETLPKLPEILEIASNAVETDFSTTEIISFADNIRKVYQAGLNAETLKGRTAYYEDVSYFVPDILACREEFRNSMDIPLTEEFLNSAKEDAEKYKNAIPKGIKYDEESVNNGSAENKLTAEDIEVTILNCSDKNGVGAKCAEVFKERGFKIEDVGNGEVNDKSRTTLEIPEGSASLFNNLPFECTLIETDKRKKAVLKIGLDFDN